MYNKLFQKITPTGLLHGFKYVALPMIILRQARYKEEGKGWQIWYGCYIQYNYFFCMAGPSKNMLPWLHFSKYMVPRHTHCKKVRRLMFRPRICFLTKWIWTDSIPKYTINKSLTRANPLIASFVLHCYPHCRTPKYEREPSIPREERKEEREIPK